MSNPEQKSFFAKLKDGMVPWVFKKSEPKTVDSDPPPASAEAAAAPPDASANGENHPDSGDTKKAETTPGKFGRVKARFLHHNHKCEKKAD